MEHAQPLPPHDRKPEGIGFVSRIASVFGMEAASDALTEATKTLLYIVGWQNKDSRYREVVREFLSSSWGEKIAERMLAFVGENDLALLRATMDDERFLRAWPVPPSYISPKQSIFLYMKAKDNG